jgi:rare lipoprotein A
MKKFLIIAMALLSLSQLGSANEHMNKRVEVQSTHHGKASWYSIRSNGGTKTASGKKLTNNGATAAHKTLPLGTKVRVTNTNNGKQEIVMITDRGPYIKGRIIDLTIGCAERLGFVKQGVVKVKVEVLAHTDK